MCRHRTERPNLVADFGLFPAVALTLKSLTESLTESRY